MTPGRHPRPTRALPPPRRSRARWIATLATGAIVTAAGCGGSDATIGSSGAPPGTDAPTDSIWSSEIWFGSDLGTRADFLDDELQPLLGAPEEKPAAGSPLVTDTTSDFVYVNPLGEVVPVRVRAPGGERWSGDLSQLVDRGPVVVALHQTNDVGGAEPCGDQPFDELAYGTYFAVHGAVVACPTLSFTGARQPDNAWDTSAFYSDHPTWSAIGKDTVEVSWLLDALASSGLPVDDVTVIGHSQGAIHALYAGATDDRVRRVIANAGFVDTARDPEPERWSRDTWYRAFREPPIGLDYLEVVAAISPRCALLLNYDDDEVLGATMPAPDRLAAFAAGFPTIEWVERPGEHAWPADSLDLALTWWSDTGGCA